MIHLCEKIVLMGPMGLIFALYNQQIQRTKDLAAAIAAAEKKSGEDRAAKEEEERLQALEDAKNKKKAKPKKKGEEDEDPFAVDYEGIKAQFLQPVYEKMMEELLVEQGVNKEFLLEGMYFRFVEEL